MYSDTLLLSHLLGEGVDSDGVFTVLAPQLNLGQDLVGEGVTHHKAGVAHGTAEVHQTTLCQ